MNTKIVIPHEHGAWAMVSVPYVIGMMAGNLQWMHLLLFFAWLFLYMSSYPLFQAVKGVKNREHLLRWGTIYASIAMLCLALPLINHSVLFYFAIPLFALLLVNLWHAKHKSERDLLNDLCAVLIFSLGGAAAYLVGGGGWDRTMGMVVLFNFLYFTGTVFFVKTIFRKRGNARWLAAARIYHVALLIIPFIVGYPWMTLAYAFPVILTFAYAGKQMRPMKVGILEIVGVLLFLLISIMIDQLAL